MSRIKTGTLFRVAAVGLACLWPAAARADDKAEANAAYKQGQELLKKGKFNEALESFTKSLDFTSKTSGAESLDAAWAYDGLASCYRQMNQFAQAETHGLHSLKIREAQRGPNHLDVAVSLNLLGNLYHPMGRYEKAEEVLQRALKIREANLGPDDLAVAQTLSELSGLYSALARYDKAESLALRAHQIRKAKSGSDELGVAVSENNLAELYRRMGQYAQAEPLLLSCLKTKEKKLGPEHHSVAVTLNNLGILYRSMGQYDKAQPILERALKIREKAFGPMHYEVAQALNNLASVYVSTGQNAKAEPLYERSLKIHEQVMGLEHPEIAGDLSNLAGIYRSNGQLAKAEPLYRRALKIREAKLGPNHPEVARTLSSIGGLNLALGQLDQAEPLFERSLKIREAALGPDHPDVASALHDLAVLHESQSRSTVAGDEFEKSRRSVRRHVARVLPVLSASEQLTFLNVTDRYKLDLALSLGRARSADAGLAEKSAGWLANGKAVAQQSLAERARLARDAQDPNLKRVVEELQSISKQLAALTFADPKPGEEKARQGKLAELSVKEQELSKQIRAANGQAAGDDPWVEIAAVRQALADDTALIDIARFKPFDFQTRRWQDARYVAWIVPARSAGDVRLVDLGSADAVDSAIAAYQKAMADAQTGKAIRELGEVEAARQLGAPLAALAKLTLEPLGPLLKDYKQLVLCPDAGLWLVPWAALPIEGDKFALEKWNLRYVTSGRDVALQKTAGKSSKLGGPRIFANPNYDLPYKDGLVAFNAIFKPAAAGPGKRAGSAAAALGPEVQQLALRSSDNIGRVPRLPGTAQEAADVAPKLTAYAKEAPKLYLDQQAQEGVFKRLHSPRVLSLSTHGFFLPDQQAPLDETAQRDGERQKKTASTDTNGKSLENPLLRCGLLLAGCNRRGEIGTADFDDGILTGMEIVGTDLRGTELVVLSACETGLGQVNNGEGVAGLRQAFQLAGARAVVSTLWQIPDRETAKLMNDFFANLAAGQTKSDALRNAQLAMIQSRRDNEGAAHPLFWAAFTLTGQ